MVNSRLFAVVRYRCRVIRSRYARKYSQSFTSSYWPGEPCSMITISGPVISYAYVVLFVSGTLSAITPEQFAKFKAECSKKEKAGA